MLQKRPRLPRLPRQANIVAAECARRTAAYVNTHPQHSVIQVLTQTEVTVMADVSYPRHVMYGVMAYFEGVRAHDHGCDGTSCAMCDIMGSC